MKWLLLIAFVALAKSEDYDCPAGKSSKTITIREGDSFEFNSNPDGAADYKNKQKCTVKYKRAKSCKEMKFECQSFNVQNNAQNCKKGDKLFIGNEVFCQTQTVSETTKRKQNLGLNVQCHVLIQNHLLQQKLLHLLQPQ